VTVVNGKMRFTQVLYTNSSDKFYKLATNLPLSHSVYNT